MRVKSYAKINLSLDVVGKMENGYHSLKMIMHSVDLSDDIDIEITNTGKITVTTNLKFLPNNNKNHAYQAAEVFFNETKIENPGISIKINKRIPVSAGLAGGSSDAAAVLRGLNEMFNAGLSLDTLAKIGKSVGADVPYCVYGKTMLAEGIGEILTELPCFPKLPIVLVKPNVNLSTPKVFSEVNVKKINLHPDTDGMIKALENGDVVGVCKRMYNVLETPAKKVLKASNSKVDIEAIKDIFRNFGAEGVLMSGSGPTVFAIFKDEETAHLAYKEAKARYKETYITTT